MSLGHHNPPPCRRCGEPCYITGRRPCARRLQQNRSGRFETAGRMLELEALLGRLAEHLPYHEPGHPDWTPLSDLGREVRATLRGETDAE
jgi:hypothetical protein